MNLKIFIEKKDDQKCLICDSFLISSNLNILKRVKVFECKHAFHDECIQQMVIF